MYIFSENYPRYEGLYYPRDDMIMELQLFRDLISNKIIRTRF